MTKKIKYDKIKSIEKKTISLAIASILSLLENLFKSIVDFSFSFLISVIYIL